MKLQLNSFQSDGFVIQHGVPYPIRGRGDPGRHIEVIYKNQRVIATVSADGSWVAWLDPMEYGGPEGLLVSSGTDKITISNVCVGDVWICAGQSNMEMALRGADNGITDATCANDSLLRMLKIPATVVEKPLLESNANINWNEAIPDVSADFSAIGYYFGEHLRKHINIPIGLVQCAVGNTPAESWVPYRVLISDPDYKMIIERYKQSIAVYPDPEGIYEKAFAKWDKEADQAEREGRPIPGAHPKLIGPGHPWTPAGLYYGMIYPLLFFPIKGVIWYQGAAAPERAYQYRKLFHSLIRAWRQDWKQGDFPFLYLQEANFGPRREEPGEHSWAELREAQAMALIEPNTAMGVAIDVGEEKNIHPVRKKPLGERLGMAARIVAYNEKSLQGLSPFYQRMKVEGNKIRVWFAPAYGALKTSDGKPPRGFAISGGAVDFSKGNRGFVWAEAEIQGDTVLVSSPRVRNPVAVRYGWAQNPDVNLVNAVGLPACPFRSDDYPGITIYNY